MCIGDSGGSMTFEENGLHYIRGIVSVGSYKCEKGGIDCRCDSMHYALFTDAAKYLPWIYEKTECQKIVRCGNTR